MRLITAILFGKLIAFFIKLLRLGGGSAAPGLLALRIDPELVKGLSSKIPRNVVITGTNGKTTTAKMLNHFAKASGLKVIRNHTGSNLERGIASTLISASNTFDLGIWELDEAAFNSVAPKLNPDLIVFLNVFRDQLDRYGEIDSVVKKWCQTLQKLDPKTSVLVNGDDTNTSKLSKCFKGHVQKFGIENYKITGEAVVKSEEQENLNFETKNVKLNGLNNSVFQLEIGNLKLEINLPLPGIYNIYNFLAGFASGTILNMDPKKMVLSLKDYSPAFGRVEKLPFGYIFLIKNPAGATAVFETITPNIKPNDRLLLALNDNLADGTDVSWIWDGNFEKLKINKLKVICSGTRANDLALRLKYAGFDIKTSDIHQDLKKALREARTGLKGRLFILPTYTAMLKIQAILTKAGIKKRYWEQE